MPTVVKKYQPVLYVPTAGLTGTATPFIYRGENVWLRTNREKVVRAECFAGNLDLSETIASTALTGTLTTSTTSRTVTGSTTAFLSELHLGQFILIVNTADKTKRVLAVVESIESDTAFTACVQPTLVAVGSGYRMPVIFPMGTKRATLLRGNAVQFPRGHILAVGDGVLRLNGTALNASLTASRTPQFALWDAVAGTYTINDVGIDKPAAPPTLTAVTSPTAISNATNATPIVVTSTTHGLLDGDQVNISGILGNYAANGIFKVANKTADTFELTDPETGSNIAGIAAWASGGTIWPSQNRAGDHNIRICAYNTKTLGFSQPSDVTAPVTLTAGQSIKIVFNTPMAADADAYLIFSTVWRDNSDVAVESRFQGPWYKVRIVTAAQLIDATYTTGREAGASITVAFPDGEIESSFQLLTFDNFLPEDAEFVEMMNGIPVYLSCLGGGFNAATKGGTSPGPVAIPSKPSNPEAVLLNKAITTARADTIIGSFDANGRLFTLCQNSLQTLILTTVDSEPITFRSLWDAGFRNPYNVVFVKDYIYGFSTQGIVRSVAGGDESTLEFEMFTDVNDIVKTWKAGHVLVGYDPKNRAVCFFHSGIDQESGYFVTTCLPFLLDKQIWNPPIKIKATNRDMIVSGVATVGENLEFTCGGYKSDTTVAVDTFRFDAGDSETKDWYLAWNFSDENIELAPKNIKGLSATGRFTSGLAEIHGVHIEEDFNVTTLEDGHADASLAWSIGTNGNMRRKRKVARDWANYSVFTMRVSGSCTDGLDRFDELVLEYGVNASDN